jgi:tight adherence protein B
MQTLILVGVFFGSVVAVIAVWVLINRRRLEAMAALRDRMRVGPAEAQINILRDTRKSTVPVLDRILAQQTVTPALEIKLQRAGTKWSVGEYVIGSGLAGVVGLLVGQQWGVLVAVIAGLAGLMVPTLLVGFMTRRRMKKFEEQLPEAIDMIVNAMRAGFSFQAAMKFVGEEVPTPLGEEFMRFYDEQRLGVDVRRALLDMQERVGSLDIKMFVTSLLIQRETGGNLSEILLGLATIIRERSALRDQIDTLTAEPKFTGNALAALPVIAFILLSVSNGPMMAPMVETQLGRYMLVYAALSILLGFYVMRRLADIDI